MLFVPLTTRYYFLRFATQRTVAPTLLTSAFFSCFLLVVSLFVACAFWATFHASTLICSIFGHVPALSAVLPSFHSNPVSPSAFSRPETALIHLASHAFPGHLHGRFSSHAHPVSTGAVAAHVPFSSHRFSLLRSSSHLFGFYLRQAVSSHHGHTSNLIPHSPLRSHPQCLAASFSLALTELTFRSSARVVTWLARLPHLCCRRMGGLPATPLFACFRLSRLVVLAFPLPSRALARTLVRPTPRSHLSSAITVRLQPSHAPRPLPNCVYIFVNPAGPVTAHPSSTLSSIPFYSHALRVFLAPSPLHYTSLRSAFPYTCWVSALFVRLSLLR